MCICRSFAGQGPGGPLDRKHERQYRKCVPNIGSFVGRSLGWPFGLESGVPIIGMRSLYWPRAGHSLGGAMAILCAMDVKARFDFEQLQVYTFGAPRVGNRAFAREYERTVPETWNIINDKVCPSAFLHQQALGSGPRSVCLCCVCLSVERGPWEAGLVLLPNLPACLPFHTICSMLVNITLPRWSDSR
jgi:Lipase (class 3)